MLGRVSGHTFDVLPVARVVLQPAVFWFCGIRSRAKGSRWTVFNALLVGSKVAQAPVAILGRST